MYIQVAKTVKNSLTTREECDGWDVWHEWEVRALVRRPEIKRPLEDTSLDVRITLQ
jgi:hypothetical protein